MRILLIDDDPDFRNLLAHYIRPQWPDASIDEFDPLERGVPERDFPLGSYQAIILDYMLGRGDGLEWLQKLKQRPDCPKVLFLTGAGNEAGTHRRSGREDAVRGPCRAHGRPFDRRAHPHSRDQGAAAHRRGRHGARVSSLARRRRRAPRRQGPAARGPLQPHGARAVHGGILARRAHPQPARGPYLQGGDLNKRLAGKALEPSEALGILRGLMFALGEIHEKGILHRDLKPQNLMFRQDGTLAILDFGIAKQIDAIDRTDRGEILGTPRYMSPEQVQGRALDMRTDIYSAGVLLYQMMTGRHLFEGASAMQVALHHLNTPPPPLPEPFERYQPLLDKLLEKDRDARFRNVDEVIGFLARKLAPTDTDVTLKLDY